MSFSLFEPLTSVHFCDYFYVLMVVGYILAIFSSFGFAMTLFSKSGSTATRFAALYAAVMLFVVYLQNRILYSMCLGKIQ